MTFTTEDAKAFAAEAAEAVAMCADEQDGYPFLRVKTSADLDAVFQAGAYHGQAMMCWWIAFKLCGALPAGA